MTKHRSKPRHIESGIQAQCVKWIRIQYPGLLCYAVPNGGKRIKVEAMIMQGEGVTPGIPDLHIAGPGRKLVVIEMKAGKNGLTPEQRNIQARFTEFGFPVYTCWSLDEFMAAVRKEFGMGPIPRFLKSVDKVTILKGQEAIEGRIKNRFPSMSTKDFSIKLNTEDLIMTGQSEMKF